MLSFRNYFILLLAILMASGIVGCSKAASPEKAIVEVPRDIMGTWKTQNDESAGVLIEFKAKSLIISSDLGVIENPVVKVESAKGTDGKSTQYSISYTERGGKTTIMDVIFSPANGGELRFKSDQVMVWKRSG